MSHTEVEEAAAFLERAAAMLPDHECPPSPQQSELAALAAEHSRLAAAYRRSMDERLEAINCMERMAWLVMLASLLAGSAVAGYVHAVMEPPKQAEFLREKP